MRINKQLNHNIFMPKYQLEQIDKMSVVEKLEINSLLIHLITASKGDLSKMQDVTAQNVYSIYSDKAGTHGLKRADFPNEYAYSQAKKDYEKGQFFTPHKVCERIVNLLQISDKHYILEPCFGIGRFINFIPNENNVYGCEIDKNACTVANFLYPNAKLTNIDIRSYQPNVMFDYVIGNPPFNLDFGNGSYLSSQDYYCNFTAKYLKKLGLFAAVMPLNWLKDEFSNKSSIEAMNENYSFLCQYELQKGAFETTDFSMKVCFFFRRVSKDNEKTFAANPYSNEFVSYEKASEIIAQFLQLKKQNAYIEKKENILSNVEGFEYKLKKYLYEIKTQPALKKHYEKAYNYAQSLKTQVMPLYIASIYDFNEREKEWAKVRITENKVLAYLKKIVANQSPKKNTKGWVSTKYGFKLKGKKDANVGRTYISYNDIVLGKEIAPVPLNKALRRKIKQYNVCSVPFSEMQPKETSKGFFEGFTFNGFGENENEINAYYFSKIQAFDANVIAQKDYASLNYEQGTGKTALSYAIMKYKTNERNLRNVFVVSSAISIHQTWLEFMELQKENYVLITSLKDLEGLKNGYYALITIEMLRKYKRQIKRYIKLNNERVGLLFDESHNLANANSKRTKATIDVFSRVRVKLIATGTSILNRINELYSQMRLLYNNSVNMICDCPFIYRYNKDNVLVKHENKYYGLPFSAKHGASMFNECFNPEKTTLMGAKRSNQSVYNQNAIKELIAKTAVVRRFKEVCGDKYTIHNTFVNQNDFERNVYRKIILETSQMIKANFIAKESKVNYRKDAMLQILRQMELLIKATSVPHLIEGVQAKSDFCPNKASGIFEKMQESNERIMIGCATHAAVGYYEREIKARFSDRNLYVVTGLITQNGRKKVIDAFKSDSNGILLCTMQSLSESVNIAMCNLVFVESKLWNLPKIMQFVFRAIRFNSKEHTNVFLFSYRNTIEMNMLMLLFNKELVNEFTRTLSFDNSEVLAENLDVDVDLITEMLMSADKDSEGKSRVKWNDNNFNE